MLNYIILALTGITVFKVVQRDIRNSRIRRSLDEIQAIFALLIYEAVIAALIIIAYYDKYSVEEPDDDNVPPES